MRMVLTRWKGSSWLMALAILGALVAGSCGEAPPWTPPLNEPYALSLPPGLPGPRIPDGQELTRPRVELGRHLFYDTRLSLNETQACASCHQQSSAFAEPRTTSVGSTGDVLVRNAPSIANVAYASTLTWANHLQTQLNEQALIPLFAESPVELGLSGHEDEMLARLREEDRYQQLFPLAFPESTDPFSLGNVVAALAAFQRSVIALDSPYDRYVYRGEPNAVSGLAREGLALFFTERFDCFHCHGGFLFTDTTVHERSGFVEVAFHNTGLYSLDALGSFPPEDQGLFDVTSDPDDVGRFKAPSLRNVELTPPYFHDGSAATLEEVLAHYARGGRLVEDGPNAGDGALNPHKSEFVHGFPMTEHEQEAMVAFLRTLTDRSLLTDPALANPWPAGSAGQ